MGNRSELGCRRATRATGRRYRINLDALDVESLCEPQRLLRYLDHEKQAAVNRARRTPKRSS